MSGTELLDAYVALVDCESLEGSHVSIDRDPRGNEYVSIAPDWIDGAGLRVVLTMAHELELAVALTKDGLRLERHMSETVSGVEAVKRVLRGEDEDDDA
jgi:hypothetical protein